MTRKITYQLDDNDTAEARWRKRLKDVLRLIRWDDDMVDVLDSIVSTRGFCLVDVDKAVVELSKEYACLGRELAEERISSPRTESCIAQRFVIQDCLGILNEIQKEVAEDVVALGEAA